MAQVADGHERAVVPVMALASTGGHGGFSAKMLLLMSAKVAFCL